MNVEVLLDSPAFWLGILVFFIVLGKAIEIIVTKEKAPRKKK